MPGRQRRPRRDSDKCLIINRSVSFNLEDPFQASLLEAVDSWTNFSGNVKRLIAASLSERELVPAQREMPVQASQEQAVPATYEEWDPLEDLV